MSNQQSNGKQAGKRETEPMPASFKPAWMLMLFLLVVTLLLGGVAAGINWLVIQGIIS